MDIVVQSNQQYGNSMQLPSDLIRLIAQYFFSPLDFVRYGMICKRHYTILLQHIKQPDHAQSQVLERFVSLTMKIEYMRTTSRYYITLRRHLPSGIHHGVFQQWKTRDIRGLMDEGQTKKIIKNQEDIRTILKQIEEVPPSQSMDLEEETMRFAGYKHGSSRLYEDGYLISHTTYIKNVKEGNSIGYYKNSNSTISSISPFKNNILHGTRLKFSSKGLLLARTEFKEGVRHGEKERWMEFDGTTVLVLRCQQAAGAPHGALQQWDANGIMTVDDVYEKGRLVSRRWRNIKGVTSKMKSHAEPQMGINIEKVIVGNFYY